MNILLSVAAHKTSDGAYSIFAVLYVLGMTTLLAGGFAPVKSRRTRVRMVFGGVLLMLIGSVVIMVDGFH